MLTELRTDIATKLTSAGVKAIEYVGDAITPPCAAVVPAQPYLEWQSGRDGVPYGHVVAVIDVLLLAGRETSKTVAAAIDQMAESAIEALDDYDIRRLSQPGVVTLKGAKFIGAVLTIEELTKEP